MAVMSNQVYLLRPAIREWVKFSGATDKRSSLEKSKTMASVEIPVGAIWRFLSWLPGPLLKRKFPKHEMARLLEFEIMSRNGPVTIDLGVPATFRVWAFIANHSPFQVELDRATVRFFCSGQELKVHVLERMALRPGERKEVYLNGGIHGEQAEAICGHIDYPQARIDANLEFNAKLENFSKWVNLTGIEPAFINQGVRAASVKPAR